MCGIAGFSGMFDPSLLERMGSAVRHRGPDDVGTFHDAARGVGLAHRRLSIIDLSPLGHQPMWDVTHTVCIAFNGEIYNFRELRRTLERDGFAFRSNTDTEVLLNLYRRDGEAMLGALNGIFAFALWDTRSGDLLVARDGLGVKPLYVAEVGAGVLFGSEIKSLIAEPSLDRGIDPDALSHYLRYLWSPGPLTMLRGVRKLEPGHAMVLADGRIKRRWQYYDLPFERESETYSVEEATARTREVLRDAVARQMVSDVPVGAFLSGGLDSSAVVAFAREHADGGRLPCFTIDFSSGRTESEGFADDLPYARRVARHLGVELREVTVGQEMVADLPEMIYHLDEPQADLAPLNAMYIARAARTADIPVLLSGAGGDDIFSGYRRHLSLGFEPTWSWLPRPVRAGLRGAATALPQRRPALRRIAKAFRYADRDSAERMASYFYWLDPDVAESLVQRDLRVGATQDRLRSTAGALPARMAPLNKMLYLDSKYFLVDHNLNYTDKTAMASGVEVRVPLLDYEVVSHAASLPVGLKQRGRWGKWIFRKAMEGILPHDVIYRPKSGFGVPLREWMRGGLAELLDDVLAPDALRRRGIFDPAAVRRLVDDDRAGRVDASYSVLGVACLEIWCRHFVDAA
jgi:asparagine synthase (glutamine-hydrolysing)